MSEVADVTGQKMAIGARHRFSPGGVSFTFKKGALSPWVARRGKQIVTLTTKDTKLTKEEFARKGATGAKLKKLQIRNSKFETISKPQNQEVPDKPVSDLALGI